MDIIKIYILFVKEHRKLIVLSQSQFMNVTCKLLYNTSNMKLIGAINTTWGVALTSNETEDAVWSFDQSESLLVTLVVSIYSCSRNYSN